jgi:hypothetical protein
MGTPYFEPTFALVTSGCWFLFASWSADHAYIYASGIKQGIIRAQLTHLSVSQTASGSGIRIET